MQNTHKRMRIERKKERKKEKEGGEQRLRQVAQRATIAHLRAIINPWGHFRCSIWLKFKLIQNIMHVIITCKLKRHPINSSQEKDLPSIFLDAQLAANSILSRKIWPKLELIQALMYVLVTCKHYKDHR